MLDDIFVIDRKNVTGREISPCAVRCYFQDIKNASFLFSVRKLGRMMKIRKMSLIHKHIHVLVKIYYM